MPNRGGERRVSETVLAAGRVAVVTGAASGIGLALCERLVGEGLRVVMADVERPALAEAAGRLAGAGGAVLAVPTDVSEAGQVDALRERALEAFGAVHLLCSNAGVAGASRPLWDTGLGEWDWILGVNLWGAIHCIRSFVPVLLEQDAAHVVFTASLAGLVSGVLGPYSVSKHAVVALSEGLWFQLRAAGGHVGVSVLCPGWVRTRLHESERNRPASAGPSLEPDPAAWARAAGSGLLASAMDPAVVADHVMDAVRTDRFYVLTHPDLAAGVHRRAEDVLAGGPPGQPF